MSTNELFCVSVWIGDTGAEEGTCRHLCALQRPEGIRHLRHFSVHGARRQRETGALEPPTFRG